MRARLAIELAGMAARAALGRSRGRVVAVFSRSFYREDAEGRLVCIGPPSIGPGPLNALARIPEGQNWRPEGLRPGAPADSDGEVLSVGDRFAFRLRGMRSWRARPVPEDWSAATLATGLAALAASARARARRDGLAPLVPALATGDPAGVEDAPLLGVAATASVALGTWLRAALRGSDGIARALPADAEWLIGLGPGLTPAGDDLLGGAMVTLAALGHAAAARRLADLVLPLARERTHAISAAHLACAAGGEGMAALHDTLACLASPGAPGLEACLDSLEAIGHTSGWDALAGAVVVIAAVLGTTRPSAAREPATIA